MDRVTLERMGVSRRVLDRAALPQIRVVDRIRRLYTDEPFDVATLARRACLSESAVRRALSEDEKAGLVWRVAGQERPARWVGQQR